MTPTIRKNKSFHVFAVFLTFLLLSVVLLSTVTAFGAGTRTGSFTLTLQETLEDGSHKVLPDVRLKLYKAGAVQEDNGAIAFVPDAAFASADVDPGKLTTASAIADAAEKLAGAVDNSGISPLEAVTDTDGTAVFSGLDTGMYLIIHNEPDSNLLMMPMLLSIPYVQEAGSLLYDVQAFPKTIEPEPTVPPVPTETPDVTGTPEPTETPDITSTPTPTETPDITDTPTPTETPDITDTPAPTETPVISASPVPTKQPAQTLTPEPSSPNLPSDTDTPGSTNDTAPSQNPADRTVKTGDETPIAFFLLLLMTTGLLIGIIVKQKSA